MRSVSVPFLPSVLGTLTQDEAAAYLGFPVKTFDAWVRRGLLPAVDPNTGGWTKYELDQAIQKILQFGVGVFAPPKATYITIPNCQHLRKNLSDGRIVYYMRHRILGRPLPSNWRSPEFARALIACERERAAAAGATDCAAEPQNPSSAPAGPSPTDSANHPKVVTQNNASCEPESPPAQRAARILSDSSSPPPYSRRRAGIMQADIARIIRAAKQTGATRIELRLTDSSRVIVHLQPEISANDEGEVVL